VNYKRLFVYSQVPGIGESIAIIWKESLSKERQNEALQHLPSPSLFICRALCLEVHSEMSLFRFCLESIQIFCTQHVKTF